MSLTLVTNPVETVSGEVRNVFAGFEDVEFIFKREDLQINSVGTGANNKILIQVTGDLTSDISIGDIVYLFAESSTSDFEYDLSAEILDISYSNPITSITIDSEFIENSTSGYINYLKNYYVECEIVDSDNQDIKVLPFTLKDDGDQAGNITINVSIVNDKNTLQFETTSQELEDSRVKFKVQYRQVYDGSSESYTLISDEVILVYATEQMDVEELLNDLDNPQLYIGYPCGAILAHSDSNVNDTSVQILYDEKDINEIALVANQLITTFSSASDYGFLFSAFQFNTGDLDADTKFVEIKARFGALPEYEPTEYGSDYKIT